MRENHRRGRARGALCCVAAILAMIPATALARRDVDGMTLSLSLFGAKVSDANVAAGTRGYRGTIDHARLERSCILMLQFFNRAAPVRLRLGDVRLLQGDDVARIEFAFVSDRNRSILFELDEPEQRYPVVLDALHARAAKCGATITGPPRLRSGNQPAAERLTPRPAPAR